MPKFHGPGAVILMALSLAFPMTGRTQGTAPAQGVTQPRPPPQPEAAPPAPKPGTISDGRPRVDRGGGTTRTTPDTTGNLPLPPAGQADPRATR